MAIPQIKVLYKIRYRIAGYTQEFETPDSFYEEELEYNKADIAGFEGVHSVYSIPVDAHTSPDDSEGV